jgi:hypothetical protein
MALKLYWFSHRYTDADQDVQAANLTRARDRLAHLAPSFRSRGIVLSAPWLDWAEAGLHEEEAWRRIGIMLPWYDGIALDCDGAATSPGMLREFGAMLALGRTVEVVR